MSKTGSPLKPMTQEESYAQRRELFKNIWKTAMKIDPNADIMSKPKVIKTLRMDEIDRCPVGKSKKDRIKNLRHVCNKILDFCDKQEADDVFYNKVLTNDKEPPETSDAKPKKTKARHRKKINRVKGMFPANTEVTVAHYATDGRVRTKSPKIESQNVSISVSSLKIKKLAPATMAATIMKRRVKPKAPPSPKSRRVLGAGETSALPSTRKTVKKTLKKKKPLHMSPS